MKKVTLVFKGKNEEKAARAILTYIIDGGGEDVLREILENNEIKPGDLNFNIDKKEIIFQAD